MRKLEGFVSDCSLCVGSCEGLGIPQLLEAILRLMPLDTYVPSPVQPQSDEYIFTCWPLIVMFWLRALPPQAAVMDLVDSDKQRNLQVPVWDTYTSLLSRAGSQVEQPAHRLIKKSSQSHKVMLCCSDFGLCWLSLHTQAPLELVERFAFYERAKKAFAVVATGWVFSFFL